MPFSVSQPHFGQIHRTYFITNGTPEQRQQKLIQLVNNTSGIGISTSYSEYQGRDGSGIVIFDNPDESGVTDKYVPPNQHQDLKGITFEWIKESAKAAGDILDLSAAKSTVRKDDAQPVDTADMSQMGREKDNPWQETDHLIPHNLQSTVAKQGGRKPWEKRWFFGNVLYSTTHFLSG
jgi:hypothetical protein